MRLALRSLAGLLALQMLWWSGYSTAREGGTSASGPSLPHLALASAPEFPAALEWLNTARPLSLGALRDKVVLLDFWTYGCINCLHILPDMQHLEATSADAPDTYAKQILLPLSLPLSIPLHTAQNGTQALLHVALTFVVCQQSLCIPRRVVWEVPVRSQAQATQSAVTLYYQMPPFVKDP